MELAIRIQIKELPEGVFPASSDELSGLVAQGRSLAETLEIARDVERSAPRVFDTGRLFADFRVHGFEFGRQAAGSHEIWFDPTTNRYTTVPSHSGAMPEGTLRAILKQAGIDPDSFLQF
jgi:predicted RNA binding protein YcfA (HicA-like mRNA interferase family)